MRARHVYPDGMIRMVCVLRVRGVWHVFSGGGVPTLRILIKKIYYLKVEASNETNS